MPREVDLRARHSGSMGGASIDQAKAALTLALAPAHVRRHLQRHPLQPPHRQSLRRAAAGERGRTCGRPSAYVGGHPRGRRHRDARRRSSARSTPTEGAGRLRQVIFLTDGAVGNESRLFEAIRERLGDRRLFTIGIGSAPNSHFMREAARLGPRDVHLHRQPGRGAGQDGRAVPQGRVPGGGRYHAGAGRRRRRRAAARAASPISTRASRSSSRSGPARCPAHVVVRGRSGSTRVGARGADPRGGRGRGTLDALGAAEDRRAARSAIGGRRRRRACARR